jgi:hypothetical protein
MSLSLKECGSSPYYRYKDDVRRKWTFINLKNNLKFLSLKIKLQWSMFQCRNFVKSLQSNLLKNTQKMVLNYLFYNIFLIINFFLISTTHT